VLASKCDHANAQPCDIFKANLFGLDLARYPRFYLRNKMISSYKSGNEPDGYRSEKHLQLGELADNQIRLMVGSWGPGHDSTTPPTPSQPVTMEWYVRTWSYERLTAVHAASATSRVPSLPVLLQRHTRFAWAAPKRTPK
jgi:hypothetical protein